MMQTITTVAAAHGESADLFASLGIDWRMLIFQIIAFALLLWVLSKFVFPVIVKAIDEREATIAKGQRLAEEAAERANTAQGEIAAMMAKAKRDAAEIINDAKDQATQLAADSDKKAKERAERIVASAHDDIARQIAAAKKALHNETLELVALATEKVAGQEISKKLDQQAITKAVDAAERS